MYLLAFPATFDHADQHAIATPPQTSTLARLETMFAMRPSCACISSRGPRCP